MIHRDACHCGAVRFEVEAPEEVEVEDCDCSIGRMSGFLHLVVPKSRFYVQAVRAIRVLRASGSGLRGERAHVSADLANGSYSRRLVSKLPSEKAVQSGPGGGVQADRGDGRSLEER